jgi:hypothetical protein
MKDNEGRKIMDKLIGILLMVMFGISGAGATAAAWLLPWLNLNKTEAAVAGLIGVGFFVFQGLWLKHSGHAEAKPTSVEVRVEDKN